MTLAADAPLDAFLPRGDAKPPNELARGTIGTALPGKALPAALPRAALGTLAVAGTLEGLWSGPVGCPPPLCCCWFCCWWCWACAAAARAAATPLPPPRAGPAPACPARTACWAANWSHPLCPAARCAAVVAVGCSFVTVEPAALSDASPRPKDRSDGRSTAVWSPLARVVVRPDTARGSFSMADEAASSSPPLLSPPLPAATSSAAAAAPARPAARAAASASMSAASAAPVVACCPPPPLFGPGGTMAPSAGPMAS